MPEKPSVFEAWSKVMADVQAIGKDGRNSQQNYSFRGIDAVMNAVGPALRTHRVVVVPEVVQSSYRDVLTANDRKSREVTVIVTYRVYGPAGDSFTMQAPGESMDVGDKGTPKAMSVAYRTVLLQALTIPTDDPDPDAHTYERAPEPSDHDRRLDAARNRVAALAVKVSPALEGQPMPEIAKYVGAALTARGLSAASVADLLKLAEEWEQA